LSYTRLCLIYYKLFYNFGNLTSTYSSTTLTDSEFKSFLHCYRVDKLYRNTYVITWHHHFSTFR